MSILVLQSSCLGGKGRLLWLVCLHVPRGCCYVLLFLAVPWVCLHFVIVVFPAHTHILYIKCESFAFYFSRYSYQTYFISLRRISFFKDISC